MLRHLIGRAVQLACAIPVFLFSTLPAPAQQASTLPPDNFAYFYQDPRPERLTEIFASVQNTATSWIAFPPLTGLLAADFKSHPEHIDRLVPIVKDVKASYALITAARLSGQPAKAEMLRAKFTNLGFDQTLNAEFAGIPTRFEDLQITRPTHLDILWGASFAAGDSRYVMPIVDYFAAAANTSELVAIDITKTAVEMTGGPKGTIAGLKAKYGDAGALQMILAATALWAIASNSRQHDYVKQTVVRYVGDHPGAPATKALSALPALK
ncbi:hypothetical protein [Bradyrhizobium septentrionale]|uniref:Uncharacterized protein n=1 Tax=Bradyrhizobium septentrionale TaxID=1404411 RepID=A0ABZ2NZ99_9BRAD